MAPFSKVDLTDVGDATGVVEVWGNGLTDVVVRMSGFPLQPSVQSELKLTLDTSANRLSAWVDDVNILDSFELDSLGVQPSPDVAGFHLNGATLDASTVDFFEVRQSTTAIFQDGFESGDVSLWTESEP